MDYLNDLLPAIDIHFHSGVSFLVLFIIALVYRSVGVVWDEGIKYVSTKWFIKEDAKRETFLD